MHQPDALSTYLELVGGRSFGYGPGQVNCASFVAVWLQCAGHPGAPDVTAILPTAEDAPRLVRSYGNLRNLGVAIANKAMLPETEAPKRGDIGLVRMGKKSLFAICTGDGQWVVKADGGLVYAPLPVVRAWKVASSGSVGAMAIGALIISTIGISSTATIAGVSIASIVGTVVLTAASIGVQYAVAALNKPKTDPQHIQQTVKQAVGPRVRHYGTVKVGGVIIFSETAKGRWYEVVITGSGRIDSVVEIWAGDKEITVNPSGQNTTLPYGVYLSFFHRQGLANETAYTQLIDAFPGQWTASHTLSGLSSFLRILRDPGKKAFGKNFPGGIPQFKQLIRGARLLDPRDPAHDPNDDGTWEWSDNAGLAILDYYTHPDGGGWAIEDVNLPTFAAFANICDELVPLKNGGFEKRYRSCGSYSFAEAQKDIAQKLLSACDGFVYQDGGGKLCITGGRYEAPTVTLGDDVIRSAQWTWGHDATERANEIKPVFVSPDHDFQETEAAAWRDEDAITNDGLTSQPYSLPFVPSHTQAQRLAKIAGRRLNTPRIGTLRCNLGGLAAYQQRFIRVESPRTNESGEFIVDKMDVVFSGEEIGVVLNVTKVDPTDWSWNPATEEGDPPPIPPQTSGPTTIEIPQALSVVVLPVSVTAGITGGRLSLTWDAPEREGLSTEIRFRRRISTSPDVWAAWQTIEADDGETTIVSGVIDNDGSLYQVEARHVATAGARSEYCAPVSVAATADPTPPDVVLSLSATGDVASLDATWVTPNSANFSASRVYWNTSNSLTGATLDETIYSAPSQSQSHTITGLLAGTVWVLITSRNGSGVESAPVSASAVVT